jgi:hypothetical protein
MSATDRKRRLRSRQRNCEIVVPCVVGIDVIELLIDLGWLRLSESENRNEIAAALVAAVRSAGGAKVSGTRGQPSGSEHGF